MNTAPGIFVRQILAAGSKAFTKYARVATETRSFGEMLKIWNEVTGRQGVYVQCSYETYEELWGVAGREFGEQLKWGELVPDWMAGYDSLSEEELGVTKEELEKSGLRATLEGFKAANLL